MTHRPTIRVLLIEDSPTDADLLAIELEDVATVNFSIDTVECLSDGLRQLEVNSYDVVLLDLNLPDSFGVDTCRRVHRAKPSQAIIVLTGLADEERAYESFKVGAQDYLVKGQHGGEVLTRAIRYAIERQASQLEMQHANERLRLISEQLPAVIWTTDRALRFTAPTTHCLGNTQQIRADVGIEMSAWCERFNASSELCDAHQEAVLGRSVSVDLRWKSRSYSVHIEPLRDATSEIVGTIGVSLDVSQQRRMSEELHAARQVQQALFPRQAPHLPGFDIAGQVFPAEETAGDCFDFITMHDGWLGLAVGDVAGHGLGPALLTAELRAYLRLLATMHSNVPQILEAANRLIASDLEDFRFVTLFFGRLHAASHRFEYASAGHTAYVVRASGKTETLASTGVPLGLFPETHFTAGDAIELRSGDVLVLPTDGIQEAQTPDRKMFGTDRFLRFVHNHRHEPAMTIIQELRAALGEFTQQSTLSDDMTAVIVRVL